MYRRVVLSIFAVLVASAHLAAQETRLPTEAEVKALQTKYQAERRDVLKKGIDKHFLPDLMKKAEVFAQQADRALSDGRLFQASESYRQARWLLPYQSRRVPAEHVGMILGSMRLRQEGSVTAVAFSPDGRFLASAGKDHAVRIWDLENGHELVTYTGHANYISAIVFSSDGKTITSAAAEKDIRVWDPLTGKDIRKIPGAGEFVYALAYTPDGKYLVSGQGGVEGKFKKENTICIYEAGTDKLHRTMSDFRDHQPHSLSFSGDGSKLAVGTSQGETRLYEYPAIVELLTKPATWTQQVDQGEPCEVVLSPDGRTLVRLSWASINFFNVQASKEKGITVINTGKGINATPGMGFTSILFGKDGKTLVIGCSDGTVRLYDADTLMQTGVHKGHSAAVHALAFNPSGTVLASGGSDHTVRLWQSEVVIKSRDFAGHEGPAWKSSFSSDGRRLVSAGADRTVRIWDVASDKVLHTLTGHTLPVTFALFSPDGKFVASAGGDRKIKIWDADTGKQLHELAGHTHTVTCLDFSSDGKKLVSGGVDRLIKVWDWQAGKELLTLSDHRSIPAAVVFRPDGKQIASGNVDATIRLYDADSGKLESSWSAHASAITGLAYSPDGNLLASSGADQLARVWSLDRPGAGPILLSGHAGPVSAVAFRKDGRHVATCGSDMLVKLWRLEGDSGKDVQTFRGHKDWVTSVNFSKDGFYIVSSGVDRIVKINEITTRDSPLAAEPGGNLFALSVSPDGKYIAAGGTDKSIWVWERATGNTATVLAGHHGTITALAFAPDSKRLASGSRDKVNDGRNPPRGTLKLWDVATGQEMPRQQAQMQNWDLANPTSLLAVSPDNGMLFVWETIEKDKTEKAKIGAYDLATGAWKFEFIDAGQSVVAVSFSANGKAAAIADRDGTVRLYDLEKKGQMFPGGDWFLFDKGLISDMSLSADGAILVAGTIAGELRICKVAGKEVLHKIAAHGNRLFGCLVSPDGKRVATAGDDNLIKLWDLASGKELRRWSMQPPGETNRPALVSNLVFSPDGKQLITSNSNATLFVLELP